MSWPTGTFTPAIPSVFSGKSSHIRQRKMGSDVWRHFEKYKDEDGKVRARCNLCKRDFDGSSRMGTTRLRNHYESCQRKKRGGGGDKSDEAASAIKEKAVMDQQLNHLDTTRMIIKRGIRSGDSINAADIMDVYNLEKEKLRKYFKKLRCRFYLKADEVRYGGDYSCLTVSFIDDDWKLKKKIISFKHIEAVHNFGEYLKNVLLEWGIKNDISSMINMTYHDKYVISANEIENWFSGRVYALMIPLMIFNGNFPIAIEIAKSLGKEVTAEVIPSKQDLILNWKQWLNTGGLLNIALGLKEAFFVLKNMDLDFKSINLTKEQWDQVRVIYECYEDLTDVAFLDHYETANRYFPIIFAAVLDPRFKMDIVQHWYKKIYGDECEAQLTVFTDYFINVYNEYARGANNFKLYTSGSQQTNSSISYEMLDFSGKLCKSSYDHDNVQSLNSELHLYLNKAEFMEFRIFGQSVVFEGLDSNMVREAYELKRLRFSYKKYNAVDFQHSYLLHRTPGGVAAKDQLTTRECENLGFTGLALCSDCNTFAEYVKNQELVSDCLKCCAEDSDDSMSKVTMITYSGAIVEVCMRKLVFYPEIVGFIEEEKDKFPTLKVQYVFNSPPKLIMLDDEGQHKETIRIDNWKREHMLQFLQEKVKPTSAKS
ncbi:hypothetical protein JRO89_XS03G0032300 [Xanthoceras sorbifolium]|uniref:Selenoprotein F n=1 Tax=Xanthoceras sorbifolium TaxID=99658 RepID=A0ABQ8I8G1_9ROSI|nr:hypothetical protein JRO89_XS03G0032300 [Xanthoceras sorbifolium]